MPSEWANIFTKPAKNARLGGIAQLRQLSGSTFMTELGLRHKHHIPLGTLLPFIFSSGSEPTKNSILYMWFPTTRFMHVKMAVKPFTISWTPGISSHLGLQQLNPAANAMKPRARTWTMSLKIRNESRGNIFKTSNFGTYYLFWTIRWFSLKTSTTSLVYKAAWAIQTCNE